MFNSVEDLEYAIERLTSLRNSATSEVSRSQSPPQVVTIESNGAREQEGERRSAHNICKRFQKKERFTAKLGEDVTEYISN